MHVKEIKAFNSTEPFCGASTMNPQIISLFNQLIIYSINCQKIVKKWPNQCLQIAYLLKPMVENRKGSSFTVRNDKETQEIPGIGNIFAQNTINDYSTS